MKHSNAIPTPTTGPGNAAPVCQNCATSTTPLWRRDESGSVLCNACGLFLKLHGTARPISLKTDVIKSRNRVKTSGPPQKRKAPYDGNGLPASKSESGALPPNQQHGSRLHHQATTNGSNSPTSRTQTPTTNHVSNIAPQHMFDGVTLSDHPFQSPAMPHLHLRQPSPGSASSATDRHHEIPQTHDGVVRELTQLRTRVSELEVINDLYRSTVSQYQQGQSGSAPQAEMTPRDGESHLRDLLQQSQQREDDLKRRVEELENEVADLRGEQQPTKKAKTSEYPEPPQTITASTMP